MIEQLAYLKMTKVKSKEAEVIERKTIELLQDWMPFLNTITSDNEKEFEHHKSVAKALDIDFCFSKPYHSWQ
jgi:IS30 family transposase